MKTRVISPWARISTWVNASLMAGVAVVAAVVFFSTSRLTDAPSVSECVEDWNGRAGESVQAQVVAESYRSANVVGWFAKGEYPGCGIGFVAPEGDPFLSCTRAFVAAVARLTDWSCEWTTPAPNPVGMMPSTEVDVVSGWRLSSAPHT